MSAAELSLIKDDLSSHGPKLISNYHGYKLLFRIVKYLKTSQVGFEPLSIKDLSLSELLSDDGLQNHLLTDCNTKQLITNRNFILGRFNVDNSFKRAKLDMLSSVDSLTDHELDNLLVYLDELYSFELIMNDSSYCGQPSVLALSTMFCVTLTCHYLWWI